MAYNRLYCLNAWQGNVVSASILTMASIAYFACYGGFFVVGKRVEDSRVYVPAYLSNDFHEKRLGYIVPYVLSSKELNDVIFIGDSTCMFDMDVSLFEKRTGLKAFNLGAILGTGREGVMLMFEEYVRHHPSPRVVVLIVGPHFFADYEAERLGSMVWSLGASDPPKHENDLEYFARLGVLVASKEASRTMESRIESNFGVRLSVQNSDMDIVHNWRGSFLVDGHSESPTEGYSIPVGICEDGKKQMGRLLQLCQRQGSRLVLLAAPIEHGPLQQAQIEVEQYFRDVSETHPQVLLPRRQFHFDHEFFFDLYHLNRKGAELYTENVAKEVLELIDKGK